MGSLFTRERHHGWAVGTATLLFAAVFALRLVDPAPESGLTFLYVIPVVLVGFEFGAVAGFAAGAAALGLFAVGNEITDTHVGTVGYLSRGFMLLLVGLLAGDAADRMRAALQQARVRARHFEIARDLLATADLDGYFIELNGSWERTLGWTAEELMAKPFVEFVHPDDLPHTVREAERLSEGPGTATFTNRYRTRDGDWRWIEWSSQLDAENQVIYAAARDVSDRVEGERARQAAEERFRRVFEDSPTGMAVVCVTEGRQNEILEVNDSLVELLGAPREEVIGSNSLGSFAHPDDRSRLATEMAESLSAPDGIFRGEIRIIRGDGETRWVRVISSAVEGEEGEPAYRLSQLVDIEDRKQAELELERQREFQHALLESLNSAVLACDENGETTFLNRAAREWRFQHQTLSEWAADHIRRPDGTTLPVDETPTARALKGEIVRHEEVGLVTQSGLRTLLVNGQPIVNRNGERLGAVVAGDDITERKLAEEQLRHLADHDPLSGVYNRRRFEIELERELAANANSPGGAVVLILDVDGFKQINDNLGHATGDAVIARLGDRLTKRLRTSDVVARLGGDEFAVILRRTSLEQARHVADSIRELICKDLADLVAEPVGPVTLSMGLAALSGTDTLDPDLVLRRADRAMYEAKRAGGGQLTAA